MIDFLVTYYNPETLERDSNGVLGLDDQRFFGKNFIPVSLDDGLVNPKFIDFASKVGFFRCECDRGSASFRGENRTSKKGEKQYWYAYKRVNGKLNRFNIGDISKINYETIEKAIAVVCGFKQEEPVAQPVAQLAGHGKSDRHIQPSLMEIANDPVTILTHKNNQLERQNKELNNRLIEALDKIREISTSWDRAEIEVLTDRLAKCEQDLKVALVDVSRYELATRNEEKRNSNLRERIFELERNPINKILKERDAKLLKTHEKLLERDRTIEQIKENHRNTGLAVAVVQQRNQELEHTIETQAELIKNLNNELNLKQELIDALHQDVSDHREEAAKYHNELQQLQWEASKREDDVQGYAYMYDEHSKKIFEYYALIEKYRTMTIDKTKKGNPRYAYLIDFLSDIDKIS